MNNSKSNTLERFNQALIANKLNDERLLRLLLFSARNKSNTKNNSKSAIVDKIIDIETKIPAIKNIINTVIDPLYTEFHPDLAIGNHLIGRYAYNPELIVRFSIPETMMALGIGPTGSGKSCTVLNMALSIINSDIPNESIGVITPKLDSEWRNLMPLSKQGKLLYFTKKNLFFNPLEDIENVSREDTIRNFCSIFVSEERFMEGVGSYLYDCIIQLKQKNENCNVFDLINFLEKKREKSFSEREYNAKALTRLKAFAGELGPMLNVIKGIRIKDLVASNWVLEFVTQSQSVFNLISSLILSRIYLWKAANDRITQKLMILEDAQFGTLKQRGTSQFTTEQPFIFQVNLLGRYIGLKFLETVQGLSQVSDFLKQNSSLVIVKGLHSLTECYEAGKILNIKEKEKCEELINLKINEAYVIDKMRSTTGVKIITDDFPDFSLTIGEINKTQENHMKEILSYVVFKDDSINTKSTREELNYNSKILIQDLKRFPFDFQSEREIRLNVNAKTIADNLDDLVKNKWLYRYENKISLGKGKGQFQPYVFTDKTVREIGKQEIKGKGSIEHAFWQCRCAKYFTEKGYNVEIEHFPFEENNSGKNQSSLHSIDVVACNDSEKIAVEVELNDTPHIRDNIVKCINAGFDYLIIAVYGSKLMKRIQSMVLSNAETEKYSREGKIKIETLSSFLNI